nr:immunoglobulin light chain junction region [Macaca mulatta]MOW71385.1 immunoglobulin light chain junction region [Macaca mulatta]MOW72725.1 immunoglobulin light chain junction region [Macaca mulatta]
EYFCETWENTLNGPLF